MTPLRLLFSLVLIVSSVSVAQARTVWVDDQLYLPVRSGAGTQYRIIENALPSGTPLEVLETAATRSLNVKQRDSRLPASWSGFYAPLRSLCACRLGGSLRPWTTLC